MVAGRARKDLKPASGIRMGLNPGHVVTRKAYKHESTHGKFKAKLAAVREVVAEVAGLMPYEKRVIELLKVGREKRALRFLKRRAPPPHLPLLTSVFLPSTFCPPQLGTHQRATRKREKLSDVMRAQQTMSKKK